MGWKSARGARVGKHRLTRVGDVFYFPKDVTIKFETERGGYTFYVSGLCLLSHLFMDSLAGLRPGVFERVKVDLTFANV